MHRFLAHAARAGLPALLASVSLGAAAATVTTSYAAPFDYLGPTDTSIPLQVAAFSGPGTLIGVYAALTVDFYSVVVASDAPNGGTAAFQASGTLSLTQPPAFQLSPSSLTLSLSSATRSIPAGNGEEIDFAAIPSIATWAFQTNANLAPYVNGPFNFTLSSVGSLTDTVSDGVDLFLVSTAKGKLSVTYTSALEDTPPIPEPGSSVLLAGGLAALAWHRRRRRR